MQSRFNILEMLVVGIYYTASKHFILRVFSFFGSVIHTTEYISQGSERERETECETYTAERDTHRKTGIHITS